MTSNILFLDHVGALGGAELSLLDIAAAHRSTSRVLLLSDGPFRERLRQAGVRVEVLAPAPGLTRVHRETHVPGPSALMAVLTTARQVARRARTYDLIYANSQKSFVIAAVAGVMAHRRVVWHLRDILSEEHFSRTNIRLVVGLANLFAARVIANSRATATAFGQSGGQMTKVGVVHNGVRGQDFEADTEEAAAAALRASFGAHDRPLIGVFSRLAPWKGQQVVLEALSRLPGVHALFAGEALFGEEEYRESLRTLAEALGLADRAHFLGFRADVPRLMRAVDIIVHPSTAPEPFGRTIVEAMLAGRPVVATKSGGPLEIVRDAETGILVAPGSAEEIAAAIASLLGEPEKATALGRAGRARALAEFTLDRMLDGVSREIGRALVS
jgi:glycosyltransferase involved in cell wall biosynthesis